MTRTTGPASAGDAFAPRRGTIALRDGVTLPYLESGGVTGPPVVFLHGLSDSARSYEPLLRRLPAAFRALALTQRGHGDADRPLSGYGSRELAGDVVGFLDAMAIAEAVIVGHSLGAHVAQCVAARHPERVRAAVLIGAFPSLCGHPLAADLDALVGALVDPVDDAFIAEFQQSTLARPVAPGFFAAIVEESRKVPARVWQEAWAGMRDTDLSQDLARITVPVHLLWGDRDAMVDRGMQDTLLRAIPGATAHRYPEIGHAPHWEDPARVASDLVDILHAAHAAPLPHHDRGAAPAPTIHGDDDAHPHR